MTSRERLALCLKCPVLLPARKPLEKCGACKCYVRGLVLVPGAKCPRGYWGPR